jgi:hypothetical protein
LETEGDGQKHEGDFATGQEEHEHAEDSTHGDFAKGQETKPQSKQKGDFATGQEEREHQPEDSTPGNFAE